MIKIVKGDHKEKIFDIEGYSLYNDKNDEGGKQSVTIYNITVRKSFHTQLDVEYWLGEVSDKIKILSTPPSKLTDYINKYEENGSPISPCLFHDLRTKYIDILIYDDGNVKHNIIFLGYTLGNDETYFAIKAFSLSGLASFVQVLLNYCQSKQIEFKNKEYLRWLQLESYLQPDANIKRNDIFEGFLKRTMEGSFCKFFVDAFNVIDTTGYIDKKFIEQEVDINGHTSKLSDINQFMRYFSPFWKTDICVKDTKRTILYLHDELPNDESVDKIVFTIKPHLMQYYQMHWFEDFCTKVITSINDDEIEIVQSHAGRCFDFIQKGNDYDIREIDLILGVRYNNLYKIISIECKKTLTNDEIKKTNKKIKEKVLKSHLNIIDAFIHIGCFNDGVELDKPILTSNSKYKQNLIQIKTDEKVNDVPYFAFVAQSRNDMKSIFLHIIKEIFSQW